MIPKVSNCPYCGRLLPEEVLRRKDEIFVFSFSALKLSGASEGLGRS